MLPAAGPRPAPSPAPAPRRPSAALHGIEPNRERRIALGREAIGARLDLHGMDQDQARAALAAFVSRAYDEGCRAVLVITGRGRMGGGILRRRMPDWLTESPLRNMVAGVSRAHRRHGGEGAFYVALKRKG
jgi:DNA-nicking Smr family endonuclease